VSSVLIVAPHPDDEVLGCGGMISRHVSEGDDVYVVIVTKGASDVFSSEFIERGRGEAALANKVLGTKDVLFLDFPAPRLDVVPVSAIANALKDIVTQIRPSTVYLPHQGDIHCDHKAVYWATLVAARPNGGFVPSRLLCYETPSETEWAAPNPSDAFIPTVFCDISGHMAVKLDAMKCYESQLTMNPRARSLASIEALAHYRGSTIAVSAAEAFCLVREVIR
jgi:LmbE family N-acetylglucosaminyl deacetylase